MKIELSKLEARDLYYGLKSKDVGELKGLQLGFDIALNIKTLESVVEAIRATAEVNKNMPIEEQTAFMLTTDEYELKTFAKRMFSDDTKVSVIVMLSKLISE